MVLAKPESLKGPSECLGPKEDLCVFPAQSGAVADLTTERPLSLFESCLYICNREVNTNNNTFI